jgi:transcriptional regulator with XRE-family HTH domain
MRDNIVGDNIRRMREKMGLAQEELALRCDLTQGYINFLENGRRGYSRESLMKIANALGIPISQLFEAEKKEKGQIQMVAEASPVYRKRGSIYDEIVSLLNKLPDSAVDHYKMLLKAEVAIRGKQKK